MPTTTRRRLRLVVPTAIVVAVLTVVLTFTLLVTVTGGSSSGSTGTNVPDRGTDAGVNPWAANDFAVLAEALGEAVVLPLPGGERP